MRYIITKPLSHAAQNAPSGNWLFSNVVDSISQVVDQDLFIASYCVFAWRDDPPGWREASTLLWEIHQPLRYLMHYVIFRSCLKSPGDRG